MRDIGKIISFYFYALALCSILAMLHILFIQKEKYFEMTWIVLLVFGNLMRRHNNSARYIIIGFNILGIILFSVFVATGSFSQFDSDTLEIFSISILNPTEIQVWGFISYFILSNLMIVILLMTKKAKKEFSNQSMELTVKTPVE